MKHVIILTSIALIMALTGYLSFLQSRYGQQVAVEEIVLAPVEVMTFKDAPFNLNGTLVQLRDGVSQVPTVDNSTATTTTRFFGSEVETDLNNDGKLDVAYLVTQDAGGSGTFYYAVAALKTENGYVGTNAVLLGDRIAPQSANTSEGGVVFNYAIQAEGEPMATSPSLGVSKFLKVIDGVLTEVVPNYPTEADSAPMSLDTKTWTWVATELSDNTVVTPVQVDAFSVTFATDKTFSVTTDCNNAFGSYEVTNSTITLSEMGSTRMYCEDSEESVFIQFLSDASAYQFTESEELVLNLKQGGSMLFR